MLVTYENKLYDIPNDLIKVADLESLDYNNKHGYVSVFSNKLEEIRSSYVYNGSGYSRQFYKGELELISTMERNDVTYQMMLDSYLVSRSLDMLEEEGLRRYNVIYADMREYLDSLYDRILDAYNLPVSFKNFTIHRRSESGKYDQSVLFTSNGKSLEKLPNIWEDSQGVCWGTYSMNNGFDSESMDKQFFSMIFNTDLTSHMNFLNDYEDLRKVENLLELRGYDIVDISELLEIKGRIYAPSVLIICSFLGINVDDFIGLKYY